MFRFIGLCLGTLVHLLRARRSLLLENLVLRQQLAVLKRRHPRPRLELLDKLFWVAIRRSWSGWQQSLIAVTPETVVRWHRGGFRLYWKLISKVRKPVGRVLLEESTKFRCCWTSTRLCARPHDLQLRYVVRIGDGFLDLVFPPHVCKILLRGCETLMPQFEHEGRQTHPT
jgi:hypothetical protein